METVSYTHLDVYKRQDVGRVHIWVSVAAQHVLTHGVGHDQNKLFGHSVSPYAV